MIALLAFLSVASYVLIHQFVRESTVTDSRKKR